MQGKTEARKNLPEEVKRLGWVSFFTDVASEMVYPVVPLFLTSVLGAPLAVLGVIEGLAEVIVSIMKGLKLWEKLFQRPFRFMCMRLVYLNYSH